MSACHTRTHILGTLQALLSSTLNSARTGYAIKGAGYAIKGAGYAIKGAGYAIKGAGYAIKGALFISAQLSTDAASGLWKVWILIKLEAT